ncbi:histidine ammonia-lyase [Bacillus gobiensis]|uniref:histidine ammonia-lyase n=1 Tax=Bacillus gobiensis TaxID=1441095 RepID=UPI003D237149
MEIQLNGNDLGFHEIRSILNGEASVQIKDEAWTKIDGSRAVIDSHLKMGKVMYGVNTGFGKLSDTVISSSDTEELQLNLIRSHACGIGEPFSENVSRAMLLLRANALAKGYSGVRRETIQLLVDCINAGLYPIIPSQGSLGASGDLAPLSHLALVLVGEGEAIYKGHKMNGRAALKKAGLQPVRLKAKEGLALINGTQAMTALGTISYLEANDLAQFADAVASLTFESLRGIVDALFPETHAVRPHIEQAEVAASILSYLEGSLLTTKQGELRVQDAYSLRCIPQVHGAIRQVLKYAEEKLLIEINSATDNPLVFTDSGQIISGGNFHGQPIAFAMDFLGIGMAELGSISERRVERLVNPQLNDLPAFLSPRPGLESGLMIIQYAAASLVSENKTLAHPASVDSIPSSANQEDHVSMGTTAARHAYQIIENSRRILAIEAICAAQAASIRGPEKLAPKTKKLYENIRSIVPEITSDRSLSPDIEAMSLAIKNRNIKV